MTWIWVSISVLLIGTKIDPELQPPPTSASKPGSEDLILDPEP